MSLIEKIWLLVNVCIIIIILLTDPKGSTSITGSTALSSVFKSESEGKSFTTQLNWLLIVVFFFLTITLNLI